MNSIFFCSKHYSLSARPPINLIKPINPINPINLINRINPINLINPMNPINRINPINPMNPINPISLCKTVTLGNKILTDSSPTEAKRGRAEPS